MRYYFEVAPHGYDYHPDPMVIFSYRDAESYEMALHFMRRFYGRVYLSRKVSIKQSTEAAYDSFRKVVEERAALRMDAEKPVQIGKVKKVHKSHCTMQILTDDQAVAIRDELKTMPKNKAGDVPKFEVLAIKYGVSKYTIKQIIEKVTFRHVLPEDDDKYRPRGFSTVAED